MSVIWTTIQNHAHSHCIFEGDIGTQTVLQQKCKKRNVNRHCSGVCYASVAMRALAGGNTSALYLKEKAIKHSAGWGKFDK